MEDGFDSEALDEMVPMAKMLHQMYTGLCLAGFSNEQALKLVRGLLIAMILGQNTANNTTVE